MSKNSLRRVRASDKYTNPDVIHSVCIDCGRRGRVWKGTRRCADDSRIASCERRLFKKQMREDRQLGSTSSAVVPE